MASDFFDTCPVYQGGGNQRYKKIGCCSDTLMGALVGRLMIMLPCAWEFWQLTWEWKLEFLQERLENWGLCLTSRRSSLSFAQNPRKPRGGEELLMLGNVTLHLPLAGLWVGGIGWAWFWPVKKKKKLGLLRWVAVGNSAMYVSWAARIHWKAREHRTGNGGRNISPFQCLVIFLQILRPGLRHKEFWWGEGWGSHAVIKNKTKLGLRVPNSPYPALLFFFFFYSPYHLLTYNISCHYAILGLTRTHGIDLCFVRPKCLGQC